MRDSWDQYFMKIAATVASRSKDFSTQVGAVAVGPDHEIRTTGYNDFPRGIDDDKHDRSDRTIKLLYTSHAEENVVATKEQAQEHLQSHGYLPDNDGDVTRIKE